MGRRRLNIYKDINNDTRFPYSLCEFILLTTFVNAAVNVNPVEST